MSHNTTLTFERLSTEYLDWVSRNGNGRNKADLRFGQHLVNTYFPDSKFPDLFYVESAKEAYSIAMQELVE